MSARNLAGWLPSLLGPVEILVNGVVHEARLRLNFTGYIASTDVPEDDRVDLFFGQGDVAPATRTITAGPGLEGGGDLTANRTIAVKLRALLASGLGLFEDGLGIVTNAAKGTKIDAGELAVAISEPGGAKTLGLDASGLFVARDGSLYGAGTQTIVATAEGLAVLLGGGLLVNGFGIYVNPAQFAALVGGKTTAAQARGLTVRTYDTITATAGVATTSVPVAMLALFVNLAVGEVLDVQGVLASRSGTTNDFGDLVISSAAGGAGTVYSTIAANWGNTACALHAKHVATVAGVHHISLRANHAATSFTVNQRRLSYEVKTL